MSVNPTVDLGLILWASLVLNRLIRILDRMKWKVSARIEIGATNPAR
jgi:hypothetical protein